MGHLVKDGVVEPRHVNCEGNSSDMKSKITKNEIHERLTGICDSSNGRGGC